MALSTMSGPPLPSRSNRAASVRNRPLPSAPQDHLHNSPSLKSRRLPPPPSEIDHHVSRHQSIRTVQSSPSRPLPPPPAEVLVQNQSHHISSNNRGTLRRGSSPSVGTHSNNVNRPLPPPPRDDSPPPPLPPPASSRTTDHTVQHVKPRPQVPQRQSSLPIGSGDENDFEKRFYFHGPKDFPEPEEFENKPKKYCSQAAKHKKHHRRRRKRTSPEET